MAFLAVPAAEEAGGAVAARLAARKAAGKAAGRKAAASRAPAGGRNLNDLGSPAEIDEELQRRKKVAAIRKRQRDAGLSEGQTQDEADAAAPPPSAAPSSPGGGRSLLEGIKPSGAGGGLVLGGFVYLLGLTYIRSGRAGVRAWLKAKFLNDVSEAAGLPLGPYTRPTGTAAGNARSAVSPAGGPGKLAR